MYTSPTYRLIKMSCIEKNWPAAGSGQAKTRKWNWLGHTFGNVMTLTALSYKPQGYRNTEKKRTVKEHLKEVGRKKCRLQVSAAAEEWRRRQHETAGWRKVVSYTPLGVTKRKPNQSQSGSKLFMAMHYRRSYV